MKANAAGNIGTVDYIGSVDYVSAVDYTSAVDYITVNGGSTVRSSAQPPTTRLRLTRRGRAVFTTLASLPLVLAALAYALNGGMATATVDSASSSASIEYVTVAGGQSLWQLAEAIAPNEDTREVVAQILHANALESAEVFPGQQLAVPAQYR